MAFDFNTLKTTFKHISEHDPALDKENEAFDYVQWLDTGNENCLPLKPGQKPTIFILSKLDPSLTVELRAQLVEAQQAFPELPEEAPELEQQMARVQHLRRLAPLAFTAVAYGLKQIQGTSVPKDEDKNGITKVTREFMTDMYHQSEGLLMELGLRILTESAGLRNQKK